MQLLRSKRGQLRPMELTLASLALSAAILVLFIIWYEKQAETTSFEREFVAKDLAITLTTIFNSPENLNFNYNEKTSGFSIKVSPNEVAVEDPLTITGIVAMKSEVFGDKVTLIAGKNLIPKISEKNGKKSIAEFNQPIISKLGDIISIGDLSGKAAQSCPKIEGIGIDFKNIKQTVKKNEGYLMFDEKIPEGNVLDLLIAHIKAREPLESQAGKDSVKIMLGFGNYESSENILKIYLPKMDDFKVLERQRAIACGLLNSLNEIGIFTGSAVIINDNLPSHFNSFLQSSEFAMYLELGNVKSDKLYTIYLQPSRIAIAIENAFSQ